MKKKFKELEIMIEFMDDDVVLKSITKLDDGDHLGEDIFGWD